MKKGAINPQEYLDYRLILNEDFMNRNFNNHNYSLRAYSRDLSISVSFLTEIMKGKKDLSLEKSRTIFAALGFDGQELKYIENLVSYQTSRDSFEKDEAFRFISKNFTRGMLSEDKETELLMKSVYHFIMHGLVGCLVEKDLIIKSALKIGIDEFRTREILDEMLAAGYITKSNNSYTPTDININIANHPDLLKNQLAFSSVVNQYIQKENECHPPYTMAHYFTFGLDKENLALFAEGYRKLIASISKLSNNSSRAEYMMLYTSSYLAIPSHDDAILDIEHPAIPVF